MNLNNHNFYTYTYRKNCTYKVVEYKTYLYLKVWKSIYYTKFSHTRGHEKIGFHKLTSIFLIVDKIQYKWLSENILFPLINVNVKIIMISKISSYL